jgi:ABC-type multidrug transport system ATPase subunit
VIEVRQLRKVYPGGVEAVKGIDFDVSAGEVFGLLGPNGAGKSTTVGMLTTTIRPSGGTVRLAGFDVATDPLAARKVSSVVFQESVVDRALTGRDNLELHARLWRVEPLRARRRIIEPQKPSGLPTSCRGRSAATAVASGGGWRSHAHSSRSLGFCSWTSRPSGSTRASGRSCSRSSTASADNAG